MAQRPTDRSHLTHMRFKFPKNCKDATGQPLTEMIVREIDTYDVDDGSKAADFNKSSVTDELVAISIVSINGQALHGPAVLDGWNLRAKEFAMRKYMALNALEAAETEGNGEAVNPATMTSLSSAG